MAQHKASLRKSLRSALRHKRLADQILDLLVAMQVQWNVTSAKLAADNALALDADYVNGDVALFDFDMPGMWAQHKASLRASLRKALAHKYLADEIIDAIEEMQVALNALHAKLDAEAGTLDDINYVSLLSISVLNKTADSIMAQHKAPLGKSLISALSHARLANIILDSISELQSTFNAALAILDTGSIAVVSAPVAVIDPEDV